MTTLAIPSRVLTAHEQWLDALVRHQVGLLLLAGALGNRVVRILDATEEDLRAQVRDRVRRIGGVERPADVRRLLRLLDQVETIRAGAWRDVGDVLRSDLRDLAVSEPEFLDRALRTTMPVQIGTSIPPVEQLRAIVSQRPFQGRVLRDHLRTIRQADLRRIQDQVRIGLVQGEDGPSIARRIVGRARLRGRDGMTEITRRQAQTLVRTMSSGVAHEAARLWTLENRDIVSVDLFIATLDSRTTPICRALSGKRFPSDQRFPALPLHYGERSVRRPMVDPEPIGERPMKPTTERMLLREFTDEQGIDRVTRRSDLPRGTRGAFDRFARRRVRELVGRVPARTTYAEFLARQSSEFQDDVLGRVRGRLFRRGGMTLDRFVDRRTGRQFTLETLARRDAAAFRAAGLDPDDFT